MSRAVPFRLMGLVRSGGGGGSGSGVTLDWRGDEVFDLVVRSSTEAIKQTAQDGASYIETNTLQRSGVAIGKGSKRVAPSKPGEPPQVQTGALSLTLRGVGVSALKARIVAGGGTPTGETVPYARALEFGFAPRNLAPRPFMRPGSRRWASSGRAQRVFVRQFKRAFERNAQAAGLL